MTGTEGKHFTHKPLTASAVAETIEPAAGLFRPGSAGRGHWLARLVTVPSGMWLEFLRGVISGKMVIAYYAASSIG